MARTIVIANGTNEASYIFDAFNRDGNKLIVINSNKEFANEFSKTKRHDVIVGNPWNFHVLEKANITNADIFIALSTKDTDNYAACCMAANSFYVSRTICLVTNPSNVEVYKSLGIDSVICSTLQLVENIRNESDINGNLKVITIEDEVQAFEFQVYSNYEICEKTIMEIKCPPIATIACVKRFRPNAGSGEPVTIEMAKGLTVLHANDSVYCVCHRKDVDELRKFMTREK
ncbi:MAG: TrkA family potassium uptake protein [Bacilli bacterium]|nr:TrkA family potassium uptake protein [Bacilli bacterium]